MRNKPFLVALGMGVLAVIIILCVSLNVRAYGHSSSRELKLVHIIFRHGIRSPADTFPKDPHINETLFPVGWGQITNAGKLQLYNHGKYLRERYGDFFGTHYTPDIYNVQTTDVDRTVVTAQCINAGLWPPNHQQKWGPLEWQPIPSHAEPLDYDALLLVRQPCAQYHLEIERLLKTPEIQKKLEDNAQFMQELEELTGKKIRNFDDVQDVYSTLLAEEAMNLKLPDWFNSSRDKLHELTVFSYVFNAFTTKLNRLKGGVFLRKLLNDWKSVADGMLKPKERKGFLYIGHDSTIVNLLSALRVWDPQLPGYAINILMEFSLDKTTNKFGLEIFLRNTTDGIPHQLQIPDCEKFCPLSKLIELTKPVITESWSDECKSDDPNYTPPPSGGP